mmetsp:Transcript_8882/g.24598  ORF Transcript_8882/g.24598 Transcript_8882/m.24598 type:complete len:262 (+) Transcript_8882:1198-1983(+)
MRRLLKVAIWIGGDQTMKIARNMRLANGRQDVINHVLSMKGNISILEKLDCVRNQATFRHAKQVVQWLESSSTFRGCHAPLSTVFGVNSGCGDFLAPFPSHGHFVGVRQVTNPPRFGIHSQTANAKVGIILHSCRLQHFDWILFISDQPFESHIINQLEQFFSVCHQCVVKIKTHRIHLSKIHIVVCVNFFVRPASFFSVFERQTVFVGKRVLMHGLQHLFRFRQNLVDGFFRVSWQLQQLGEVGVDRETFGRNCCGIERG